MLLLRSIKLTNFGPFKGEQEISLQESGVTIVDPRSTWIDAGCQIGRDTVIYPFSFVGHGARIGDGCRIGRLCRSRA